MQISCLQLASASSVDSPRPTQIQLSAHLQNFFTKSYMSWQPVWLKQIQCSNELTYVAHGQKAQVICFGQRQNVPAFWKKSNYVCPLSVLYVRKEREGEPSILSHFLDAVAQSDHPSLLSALQKSRPFILTMLQPDHPSIFSSLQQNISIIELFIFRGFTERQDELFPSF